MKNFAKIEKVLGVRPEEMAKVCDCSLSSYYRYRKQKALPDVGVIQNLLNAFPELNSEWLFREKGPALITDSHPNNHNNTFIVHDGDGKLIRFTSLPYYKLNTDASECDGTCPIGTWKDTNDHYIISTEFLENHFEEDPANLVVLKVNSQAMNPVIPKDSLCVINKAVNRFVSESIYLIRIKEIVKLKTLQQLPDGNLRVSSPASEFPPIEIHPDVPGFEILGKVIWVGKKL